MLAEKFFWQSWSHYRSRGRACGSKRDGRRFLNSRQATAQKCRLQTHLIAGLGGRHPPYQNFTCVKPPWHSSNVSLFKVTSTLKTFSLHRMLLVLRKHKHTKMTPLNQAPTFPKGIGFESGQHSPPDTSVLQEMKQLLQLENSISF